MPPLPGYILCFLGIHRAIEMAQWVKAPASKPADLISIPRIHMLKEITSSYKLFCRPPHASCGTPNVHTRTHTYAQILRHTHTQIKAVKL